MPHGERKEDGMSYTPAVAATLSGTSLRQRSHPCASSRTGASAPTLLSPNHGLALPEGNGR